MTAIHEMLKFDIAAAPQTITAGGTVTSAYFNMNKYDNVLFMVEAGGVNLITGTAVITVNQATNASAATSSTALASTTAYISFGTKIMGATLTPATLTALTTASSCTLKITTYDDNNKSAEYTFTGDAETTVATSSREFAYFTAGATTASISTVITNLAGIINDTSYGAVGVYASANSTTMTLLALGAETCFSVTSNSTTYMTLSCTHAVGMVEVAAGAMTLSSNFSHLACAVNCDVTAVISVTAIRRNKRYMPYQKCYLTTLITDS